jgi:filamentous hemagglutinin family protein
MMLRHPVRCLSCVLLLSWSLLLVGLLTDSAAQVLTAIRPDGTLGTSVIKNGTVYDITGGTRPGNGPNLFHSFERFTVETGDTAHFSGPAGIENILSRVTGGQQSVIDGRLQSTMPGANLYLLNPSGVLFGPNASLDIRGSFHVSTADSLRFADGATLSAHLGEKSTLTVAPPAAFGFLGPAPAPITIQGSTLKVSEGKTLSVVGGDMQIVGARLVSPGGRIQLASMASPGEVMFNPLELAPDLQVDSFARLGRLEVSQGVLIDASGNGGGTVLLRGGRLRVDGSAMFADNTGPVDGTGLGLDLHVAADAVIENGPFLTTDSLGAGRAKDLRLTADSLHITHSLIGSRAAASGNAGRVSVSTLTLTLEDAGTIQAEASQGSSGTGGNVEVRAGWIMLTRGAQITGSTFGAGHGGDVTVVASDGISITGRDSQGNPSSLDSLTQSRGRGGNIHVEARTIGLSNGGIITASSSGAGDAGNIRIQAEKTFHSQNGAVTTTAEQSGGGRIELRAGRLVQLHDSEVTTSVQGGAGDAGNLTLEAPFVVSAGSQIIANAFAERGGNIQLTADVFLADPDSQVSASSTLGINGEVDIRAPVTNLSGVVAPLSPDFARATALLQDRCAARLREGTVSTFVVRGRPSLPATYDGPLPSRLYTPQRPRMTPAGADQLPVASPATRVQGTLVSALPIPPLVLVLSCAR